MNRWKWTLLIFELALFAIILILPQVDLPDFTFHSGTAPITIKLRASSAPARLPGAVAFRPPTPADLFEPRFDFGSTTASPTSTSRLSLLCTLVC
ncbi:MAG: hypothetical protein LAO03_20220 [Acidobacteriia bacterium]|nr:hypothetical protein [Terriglobia bacterium]